MEIEYWIGLFEQMKKVWFDDSWNEFSAALSDVVKQEESDKLRRLLDDMDDWADLHLYSGMFDHVSDDRKCFVFLYGRCKARSWRGNIKDSIGINERT